MAMDWAERIGRRVKLRDLHVLLAVAECGSFAKASVRLSVSHPVVSKTVSELERTLGVQLFDRSSRGVEPTAHGAALLNCGATVFNEMRQGLKLLETLSDPTSGELRIGCPEITTAGLLPLVIDRFSRRYPRIQLHVTPTQTALLQFHELRARNIDLLIGRISRDVLADDLVSETLFDERFVAVAGSKSKWARRRQVELSELMSEAWILPPYDTVPGTLILELFRASKLKPPLPSIATLSVQLTVNLIVGGRFVGVLPRSVAHFNKRAGLSVLPTKLPAIRSAASIVTVKNRTLSPTAKIFIDCARQATKEIASNSAPARDKSVRR
jgi:DNA-binding transcriptional LysR family regulator